MSLSLSLSQKSPRSQTKKGEGEFGIHGLIPAIAIDYESSLVHV